MKKLLIIILFLFSTYSFSQVYFTGTRQPLYDSGADSLIDRMETAVGKTMTTAGKQMLSNMFTMYKDSLSITYLGGAFDFIHFLDIGLEEAAKLNWANDTFNITNVDSVVFDTVGATGNGTDSYLNTNYNPSTDGVNYTLNNASFGVYSKTDRAYSTSLIAMGSQLTRLHLLYASTSGRGYINSNGIRTITTNNAIGYYSVTRPDTGSVIGYKNGTPSTTLTDYSVGIYNQRFFILAREVNDAAGGFETVTVSFDYAGRSFDGTEQRKIYNIYCYWRDNKNSITFFNE